MKLEEAYSRLGLQLPWEFEGGVGRGATTHMLIELLLDVQEAQKQIPLRQLHHLKFYVFHSSTSQAFRGFLDTSLVRTAKKLEIRLPRIEPVAASQIYQLEGIRLPSWAIFRDNSLSVSPLMGIDRMIRRIGKDPDRSGYNICYDRDGEVVCHIPNDQANTLLRESQCPIVYGQHSPVAYPAWAPEVLVPHIRYKMPFRID